MTLSNTSHLNGIAIEWRNILGPLITYVLYMNNIITVASYYTDRLQFLNHYLSAALTGTVLFSTTIFSPSATTAICLAADSMYFKSGARPYSTNDCERKKTEFNILDTRVLLESTPLVKFI